MPEHRSDRSLPTLAAELWDLVQAYAKQQTIEPVKNTGRFAALGVAGSLALALGMTLLALGLLRLLQSEAEDVFDGNWSFAPYLITVAVSAVALYVLAIRRLANNGATEGGRPVSPKVHLRPAGQVSRDDIEAKLREIRGEVNAVGNETKSYVLVVGAVVAVAVVGLAYMLGKRKAKRRTTVVEIRRV